MKPFLLFLAVLTLPLFAQTPVPPPQAVAAGMTQLSANMVPDMTRLCPIIAGDNFPSPKYDWHMYPWADTRTSNVTVTNGVGCVTNYSCIWTFPTYPTGPSGGFSPVGVVTSYGGAWQHFYAEADLLLPTVTPNNGTSQGWSSWWTYSISYANGLTTGNSLEHDMVESWPLGGLGSKLFGAVTTHGWVHHAPVPPATWAAMTDTYNTSNNNGMVGANYPLDGKFHRWGVLKTAAQIVDYLDNVPYKTTQIGVGTQYPDDLMGFVIGSGINSPTYWKGQRIWIQPPTPTTYTTTVKFSNGTTTIFSNQLTPITSTTLTTQP